MVCGGLRWFVMVCGGLSYSHTDANAMAQAFCKRTLQVLARDFCNAMRKWQGSTLTFKSTCPIGQQA